MTTATASPLTAILDAFGAGATSLDDIALRTGLARTVVEAGVEQLVQLGYLRAESISAGCPSGGCGSCPSGHGDSPGCGAFTRRTEPAGRTLVALTLTRRP